MPLPPNAARLPWLRALTVACLVGALLCPTSTPTAGAVAATTEEVTVSFPAVADSTVLQQYPSARRGGRTRLNFGQTGRGRAWALIRFRISTIPADAFITSAWVSGTSPRKLPKVVRLRQPLESWSEAGVTWHTAPPRGKTVATGVVTGARRRLIGFDVTEIVTGNHVVNLAASSPADKISGIRSRETAAGPELTVTYQVPSGPGSVPTEPPIVDETRYGACFALRGRNYRRALADTDALFGGQLDVVRVFYSGAPDRWPGKAPRRDQVVSFKYPPRTVIAGRHDEDLRTWFRTAPRGNRIWWSYYHEPEDNIERGQFTAAQYRAAWRRISAIADEFEHPALRSTLILMSWTTDARSRRSWRDYYTLGVDVFAWDVYSHHSYPSPRQFLATQRQISASTGKAFGIAEVGVELAPGDGTGRGRARFLTAMGTWLNRQNAEFVTYFHHTWNDGADHYELNDAPSIAAWTALISTS